MADYDSAFDTESECDKNEKRKDLSENDTKSKNKKIKASKSQFVDEYSKEEGRKRRYHFLSLDAYSRHKILVNEYILTHRGSTSKLVRDTCRDRTEYEMLRDNHRFLWDDDNDDTDTWEKRIAKRYYDKLFKEYCICDLTRYKENKVAMRWRIEREVVDGKGQFTCGEKTCTVSEDLKSWEVNFAYIEEGLKKNALVKLRLCPECSHKLNYRQKRKEAKRKSRQNSNKSHDDHESMAHTSKDAKQYANDDKSVNETCKSGENDKSDTSVANESDVWSGPPKIDFDKSIDEEFDNYLTDLLL